MFQGHRDRPREQQGRDEDELTLDRKFVGKAELLESMEWYLQELVNEAQGVREAIADLKEEIAAGAAAEAKATVPQAAPKRRGRPPKAAAEKAAAEKSAVPTAPKAVEKPAKVKKSRKRRKGRKAGKAAAKVSAPPASEAAPKRVGRPPKAAAAKVAKSAKKRIAKATAKPALAPVPPPATIPEPTP